MHPDFQLGAWRVQPQLNSIVCDHRTIHLEPKMMGVLVCLAQRSGEVVAKEQLVREVWRDTFVTDDVLVRCISELRKAFADKAGSPTVIQTIPKRGYRLLLPVVPVTRPNHQETLLSAWPQTSHRIYRFAAFEADLETGEVRKDGTKLPLQVQPFQVLAVLLKHSDELVTREQLRSQIWPQDTFVDSDHALNTAITKIRQALGDSAENPSFIETLPRKGYRFICPLTTPVVPSPEHKIAKGSPSTERTAQRFRQRAAWIGGAFLILALGGWLMWRSVRGGYGLSAIRSIAVLPLEDVSSDATQEYFADGLTDELIADLGQIGSLRVISRTSVKRYKGARKPLPEIARELDVDAVVEGTVLRSGDQVRITAQLIQARVDKHLWADTYQGDVRDVLGLQNQVASAIARQIRVKLSPEQQAALQNVRAINPEAYEAYLRGVSCQKRTVDGLHQKIGYFERALASQPDYADAHVGLADAYMFLGHMVALPPQEAFPRAKSEALKALQLDDSQAEAHELLGTVKFLYDWDFPGAEKEFQRSLVLNPNSADAHHYYADFLNAMGRSDEAIVEEIRIRQIDPLSVPWGVAMQQYWAGRYDLAIETARSVLAIDPNHESAHLCLGLALEQKRQFPEAIVELQKAVDLSNDQMWMAFVAHAKALAGDKVGARKILADLESLSRHTYVSPWLFAILYPDLGDKERAFFWLEKCYQGREHDLVFSRVWPMFNSLHSDVRYQELMKRVGLPE
jgi:DNA-binding winged helix-turn-helix (wHTH) protein/TolB-like protein/Tfp pilus assembly protein PilF